jgi:hypothetical protein
MPRVVFDPSVSSIVVDLLLEAADGRSSLVIPVVLDTGASLTILATDIMARLGYDPANPELERQRIVTGSGIEYAPRTTVRSATAIGQRVANLDVLCQRLTAGKRRRWPPRTQFFQTIQAHHSLPQRHY